MHFFSRPALQKIRIYHLFGAFFFSALLSLGVTLPSLQASSGSIGIINNSYIGNTPINSGGLSVNTANLTTPTVLQQLPNVLMSSKNRELVVNFSQYIFSPSALTNVVLVNSSLGNFLIQLFPSSAPNTVANFLRYVTNGAYANTIFNLADTNAGSAAIVQSGGYSNNSSLATVTNYGSIPSEFASANLSNIQGTVAMALSTNTNSNSATSQWFVNLSNNSSYLDAANTSGNAPTTVFGRVIGTGMTVVDAIAALPTDDFQTAFGFGSDLSSVPMQDGWTSGGTVYLSDLVTITNVTTIPFPYFVTSSDPSVYSAQIQGSNLVVKYTPPTSAPPTSFATISVYASDTNGNVVTNSFQVSDHKLVQTINFPPNYVTYSATNAANYILTNLPTASSGLPVTIKVASGPAKEFFITNQVVTSTTNSVVNLGVTNTVTNNVTNSVTNTAFILTGAGNVTLVATQPGDALYDAAPPETGFLTVFTTNQTSASHQIGIPSKDTPPDAIIPANSGGLTVNLAKYVSFPMVPTNAVLVNSSMGNFFIQLFPSKAPATVSNFLNYVTNGNYADTIFNLSLTNAGSASIVQSGGYYNNSSLAPVTSYGAIPSEFASANLSNIQGTVAMALSTKTNANSATSQWFINLSNNSSYLDATNTNGNAPTTVFGQVIGNGMSVVAAIAALPTDDFQTAFGFGSDLSSVPMQNGWTSGNPVYLSDLVTIYNVVVPPAVTSSDSNAFSAALQGTNLIVTPIAPNTLSAPVTISVYAADTNGNAKIISFQVSQQKLTQNIYFPMIYTSYSPSAYSWINLPTTSSGLPIDSYDLLSGPAYISKGGLYFRGPGVVTLKMIQSGNFLYPPTSATGYIVVEKGSQTISFSAISNQTNVATPSTLDISATSSVGLPVKLTLASGPATLVARKLTLTGTGTVTLIASQPGNGNYYPATSVTNSFTVTQLPLAH
jgi:cyclophilin family peptidyl-prolyl cis-trans isomerase